MNILATVLFTIRNTFFYKLYKYYITDSIQIVKEHGFKELLRQRGLKFLMVIVIFYLIRDTILYLIIPFLVAREIFF
ncbi:MAG: hypothetical protein GWN44_11365 [Calditrichae bacterium]|nr:hypothetical protein [Calditrichia bacterium]